MELTQQSYGFPQQMTMKDMKDRVVSNANDNDNLWCHLEGRKGTYIPYRVNVSATKLIG